MKISEERTGFTLLELLIVLAIIALVTLAAVPTFESARRAGTLRREASAVAADLREARSQAVASNRQVAVVFNFAAKSYSIAGRQPIRFSDQTRVELVTVTALTQSNKGSILFFPDGSSTGGRIGLARGPAYKTISVDWLLGQVVEAP